MAKLEGLNTVAANLQKAIAVLPAKTLSGMLVAGHLVFEESQGSSEVPVDTGDLKKSGYVTSEMTPHGPVVEVGYGKQGSGVDYAVIVHERLDVRHPRGGKAKYLEDPLKRRFNEILSIIAEHAKIS